MEAGQQVGEFVLVEKLGEGGFGEVWKATHQSDLARPVALKIATRPESVSAFRREEVVRLAVEHPFIVPILAVHVDSNPPYLVMEFVDGPSLRTLLDQKKRLPAEEAAKILSCVLEALGAAHGAGLVHRDVKPGNVLLRGGWYTMLADFGLSKVEKAAAASMQLSGHKSSISVERSIAGTYDYMAPEQRRGEEGDHRVDLYACGVLLYEMLTGEASPLRLPVREVSRALSDVVERAIESDPARRYQGASAMIEALAEAARPRESPPPPPEEGVVRRGITKVIGYVKRLIAPPLVAPPVRPVRRELTLLSTLEGHTSPIRHGVLHPKGDLLATASEDGQVNVWHVPAEKLLSILAARIPNLRTLAMNLHGDTLASGSEDGTVYVWSVSGREIARLQGGPGSIHGTAFSPDGTLLVALSDSQHVWTIPQGEPVSDGILCIDPPTCSAFSRDGWMLAIGARNGSVRVWQMPQGKLLAVLRSHPGPITSLCFRPDGRSLATAGEDGHVRLWKVPEGKPIRSILEHVGHVHRAAFSPDGRWLASGSADGVVKVWSGQDGALVRALPRQDSAIRSVLFTPDGAAVVTLTSQGQLRLWSVADGRPLVDLRPHEGAMTVGAFTGGGRRLVTAGEDKKVKVWILHQGVESEWGARAPSDSTTPETELLVVCVGEACAGDILEIELTVTNRGPGDLCQCWAEVDAEEPWLSGLACVFGRVPSGESRTRRMSTLLPPSLKAWTAEAIVVLHESTDVAGFPKSLDVHVKPLPRGDLVLRRELWVGQNRWEVKQGTPVVKPDDDLVVSACVESRMRTPAGQLRLALYRIDETDGSRWPVAWSSLADVSAGFEVAGIVRFEAPGTRVSGRCPIELRVESEDGRVFALEKFEVLVV